MKRYFKMLAAGIMTLSLAGCGSGSASDSSSSSGAAESKPAAAETPEAAAVPETVQAEYLEPAEEGTEPGHFSDPAAFESFNTYSVNARPEDDFTGDEVVLGVTRFGDHFKGEVSKTKQYADADHESVSGPEKLEAGAVGAVTGRISYSGRSSDYIVYNPSDEPAEFADCILIGFHEAYGGILTFSNDIFFKTGIAESIKADNPVDAIVEILGEPYEIDGDVSSEKTSAEYTWRDESGRHLLRLHVWSSEGFTQVPTASYINCSFAE